MKALITATTAATLLLAAPFAMARDDRDGRGSWGPGYAGHGWKKGHYKPRYAPAYVERYYYPAPRVVVPQPVYVPVPAPVAVPAPYPYPPQPAGAVSIGFRFLF